MTRLLKMTDICKMLSVGKSTIYELIGRGDITPVKVLGATRFAAEDVDALIERLRQRSAEAADRAT